MARAAGVTGGSGFGAPARTKVKTHSANASARITADAHHYPGDSRHMGDRILRQGMTGRDVGVMQDYLTRVGFPATKDLQFGPATRASLIAFQRSHGLRPTGVLTWKDNLVLRAAVKAAQAVPTTTAATPTAHARIVRGLAIAPAGAPPAIKAVIAAGNRIAFKPYIYGGGHGTWNDSGYDCSGSVSYALHGGGLISDTEDSSMLESYGRPGRGRWITLWANSGHVYMYVAGLRFDTSAQDATGGSRWTTTRRSNDGFVERHPAGF